MILDKILFWMTEPVAEQFPALKRWHAAVAGVALAFFLLVVR